MRVSKTNSTPAGPSLPSRRFRLFGLVLVAALLVGQPPSAEANARQLRDWILAWLGNPPIAAGGSRGDGEAKSVCLLHPWILPNSYPAAASLAMPRPVVVTARPLARMALKDGDGDDIRQLYFTRQPAAHGMFIPWPESWPSLQAGRTYQLRLQSLDSSEEATLVVQTGSAQEFQRWHDLVVSLGPRPEAWVGEIRRLLAPPEPPSEAHRVQAASLLFSAEAPPSRELQRLRDDLSRAHCNVRPR
jgi:hypothetical protein